MLASLKAKLYGFVNNNFQFNKRGPKSDILIIDDTMPDIYSGFKIQEFEVYSKKFRGNVICDLSCFNNNDERKNFESLLQEYNKSHPDSKISFKPLKLNTSLNSKLAYCIFFNNISRYYTIFEKYNIDFAYTLYPGGGFNIDSPNVKESLKKINNSKNFKYLIVNQKISKEFLLENNLCSEDKIHYIHGTPIDYSYIQPIEDKKWFNINKKTLDLAFVAHKYSPKGSDKGLDILVSTLDKLAEKYDFLKLHIVGNFTIEDVDKKNDNWECQFYGTKPLSYFSAFFTNIDAIVSPNRPNVLRKGFFDGFPLASSVMAGLHGVPMILSDELQQNHFMQEKEDFLLIKPNVESVANAIEFLIENPKTLAKIGLGGKNKMENLHSYTRQIEKRVELVRNAIS